MRRFALIAALAGLAAGCGSSGSSSSSTAASAPTSPSTQASVTQTSTTSTKAAVGLSTRTLPGVGSVLVNGQQRTLYVFMPDGAKKVTCVAACAAVWPPLTIPAGQKPVLSGGVRASLVSSDPGPSASRVVTYAGWPLYVYVADRAAGTDHGQGINSSGGLWYVIAPSGTVVKAKSSSSGGGKYNSGGSGY